MTEQDVMRDFAGIGRQKTTKEFIQHEVNNTIALIEEIEKRHHTILVGDRSFLDKPYEDCKNMTNMQVVFWFSQWRSGIIARYNGISDYQQFVR